MLPVERRAPAGQPASAPPLSRAAGLCSSRTSSSATGSALSASHGRARSVSPRDVACPSLLITNPGSSKLITVENRAADVAVLGSSSLAYASALSLARRGKKVVLLPNLGLTAPRPAAEVLRPLQLTHPDAGIVSLAAESAAYWRGLQAQAAGSGYMVLEDCRTLDLGMVRGGGMAGELLGAMQDATKAAGVRLATLRHEELMGLFPAMKLDNLTTGLMQPDGGVLNKTAAEKLLRSLCERQGVLVRDRVVLRGWRDEGDHFRLRTSGALMPDAVSLFEVEQLLVAPECWPQQAMRLFGAMAEVQVMQSGYLRCDAAASLSKLPVWRSLRMVGGATDDSPADLEVVSGYPAHVSDRDGSRASMKLTTCVAEQPGGPPCRVFDPWSWSPQDSFGGTWTAAHNRAGTLLRGVGPVMVPRGSQLPRLHTSLHVSTPDGWPVVGSIPGVEAGRIVFATAASSRHVQQPTGVDDSITSTGGSSSDGKAASSAYNAAPAGQHRAPSAAQSTDTGASSQPSWLSGPLRDVVLVTDGYSLSPLLAKIAADVVTGGRISEADPSRLEVSRSCLAAATVEGSDPWDGLSLLQSGAAYAKTDEEAQERKEALAKGARLVGGEVDEVAREATEREGPLRKFTFM